MIVPGYGTADSNGRVLGVHLVGDAWRNGYVIHKAHQEAFIEGRPGAIWLHEPGGLWGALRYLRDHGWSIRDMIWRLEQEEPGRVPHDLRLCLL